MKPELFVVFAVCSIVYLNTCVATIQEALQESEIVPDVIEKAVTKTIQVTYSNGVSVNAGNELTPTQVKDIPNVTYEADSDAFYTLILICPDAPSREKPIYREFRHWTVVNIPGNDVSNGENLHEYVGSGPPQGTGLHRYVFLLYKQNGKLSVDEPHVTNTQLTFRANSKATDFAAKYDLGDPVAANFYQAQYDDYVPIVHDQVGFTA